MSRRRHRNRSKASGPGALVLPGGATFPAGSSVTDATGMLASLQQRTQQGNQQQPQVAYPPMVPLDRSQQFWAPFGPGAPMFPAPLNAPRRDTGQPDPRSWEYDVTWNLTQDIGRLTDWTTLRAAARKVDLISQCLRVRRTEQAALEWDITLTKRTLEKQGVKSAQQKNALLEKYDTKISELVEFWSEPDTTNGLTWTEWLEMLMEEQLVIDAVSIYPRFNYGGELISLELIDGATIKPLLDERGNRPHPPAPAYQQWLYGFPRGEYIDSGAGSADWEGSAGSLIYKPRYRRVESPYGYSSVEQALTSAELWLRRQQWMVAEYNAGTAPRMILKGAGISMTPEQLRAWEDSLNDYYGGSISNRHRMRMFPEGFDPQLVDDAAERYKPDYDEFLVKLLCAHMDVQPQEIGFTPRNGLGGAGHGETQESITYRKALRPTSQWLIDLMNQISYAYLGMPRDLTFQFLGLDSEDEDGADQTTDRRFKAGRMTLNEARDEIGESRYPFAEADMPMIVTSRGVVFLEGASELVEPGEEVTPVQAPPMTAPPEGPDAMADPTVPVVAAREAKQTSTAPPKPAADAAAADEQDAKKAEMVAYRRWARKDHARPFEFEVVTKADAELAEVDLTRVVFKADDAGPKVQGGRAWPGWEHDLKVAKHYAPLLSEALTGAVDALALAEHWLSVRKAADPSDAQQWLYGQDVALGDAIGAVLREVYDEGFLIGQHSALAMLAGGNPDWGDWTPGHAAAARALLGDDINLQRLLSDAGITIQSIAANRLDLLAQALADGLAAGDSVATLTGSLSDVLDDPAWAELVALTETTRAVSYATQQTYLANGIAMNDWMTALDQRVCVACDQNEAYGDVPVGQDFPSGQSMPPAHPACRCALAPVTD